MLCGRFKVEMIVIFQCCGRVICKTTNGGRRNRKSVNDYGGVRLMCQADNLKTVITLYR